MPCPFSGELQPSDQSIKASIEAVVTKAREEAGEAGSDQRKEESEENTSSSSGSSSSDSDSSASKSRLKLFIVKLRSDCVVVVVFVSENLCA